MLHNLRLRVSVTLLIAVIYSIGVMAGNKDHVNIDEYVYKSPEPIPTNMVFENKDGQQVNLQEFVGQVVVLNLWSTWCLPCVKEMPSLSSLQNKLGNNAFVLPLSLDKKGVPVIEAFYKKHKIDNLPIYVDTKFAALKTLKAQSLPTTYVIDKQGYIRLGMMGLYEWDSDKMVQYIKQLSES